MSLDIFRDAFQKTAKQRQPDDEKQKRLTEAISGAMRLTEKAKKSRQRGLAVSEGKRRAAERRAREALRERLLSDKISKA